MDQGLKGGPMVSKAGRRRAPARVTAPVIGARLNGRGGLNRPGSAIPENDHDAQILTCATSATRNPGHG